MIARRWLTVCALVVAGAAGLSRETPSSAATAAAAGGELPYNRVVGRQTSGSPTLTPKIVRRLHQQANAARWNVAESRFAAAIEAGLAKAFAGGVPETRELERYLSTLHVEDVALACACADGNDAAWDHFVATHRPVLYRSADALYADLFGLQERDGERQSLFRYFHGRSSLATWLRAVLAQRVVDGIRSQKRIEPLPEADGLIAARLTAPASDPDRPRYLGLISSALAVALHALTDRNRLRLSLYYVQQLTLAQTGRVLNEHEATVSRQLTRTRGLVRKAVERHLRQDAGLSVAAVSRCFDCVIEDAGPLDLGVLLRGEEACKNGEVDRSI